MIVILLLLILSLSFSQTVARVDGRVITLEEFNRAFETYWRELVHINGGGATVKDRREFLFEYIKGIIIEEVASNLGISVSDGEVNERLKKWGITEPSKIVFDMIRREILLEKLTERVAGNVRVSEGEIEAYYLLNRREFYYPEQVKLIRVVAEDRRKAERAYELLKKGQLPDGEGVLVGEERWYSVEALPRRIRRSLYPYRIGKLSRPIDLETGYLILKITDRREAGFLPLSEVKERVRSKLLKKKKEEVMQGWFRDVLKHYDLVIYLEELEPL